LRNLSSGVVLLPDTYRSSGCAWMYGPHAVRIQ